MVTEDYVSFEIAKLLKENGFEGRMHTFYTEEGTEMESAYVVPSNFFPIYRPTLQMAMKWLRDAHKIGVFPSTYAFMVGKNGSAKHVYGTTIVNLETYELMTNDLMPMPTYEEATEAAIKYCLENLI